MVTNKLYKFLKLQPLSHLLLTFRQPLMRRPTNFLISMITYCPLQRHLADSWSDEGSSSCQNVNNKQDKVRILMNLHEV